MAGPACRRRSGRARVDSWFSKKRSTLGGALVLTSPGIPMIFEGQELLEDRWFQDTVPIDWSRAEDEHGILGMYRDLIALRRNLPGVTRGLCGQNIHIYHFDDGAKLIAFHRWEKEGPTDSVVVVVNMTNQNRDGYRHRFSAGRIVENALQQRLLQVRPKLLQSSHTRRRNR